MSKNLGGLTPKNLVTQKRQNLDNFNT